MIVNAYDSNMNLLAINVPYVTLHVIRRYYEPGEYQLEIPDGLFSIAEDESWRYISLVEEGERLSHMSKRGDILCRIDSWQYTGDGKMLLSGYFVERSLYSAVCAPGGYMGATYAETLQNLISRYYTSSRSIGGVTVSSRLVDDITVYSIDINDMGPIRPYYADGQNLGDALSDVLQMCGYGQRTTFDTEKSKKPMLHIFEGKGTVDGVSPLVLSEANGDISNVSVLSDNSAYRNSCVVKYKAEDGSDKYTVVTNGIQTSEMDGYAMSLYAESNESGTDAERLKAAQSAGNEKLLDANDILEIEASLVDETKIDPREHVGMQVILKLDGIGYDVETRIVEIDETIKRDGHRMTVGFGSKRISHVRRAMRLWR